MSQSALSKSFVEESGSFPSEGFPSHLPGHDPHSGDPSAAGSPAWKQEVNQRLAAHRNRRGGPEGAAQGNRAESTRTASGRAAEAAARVAARYAKAPSYSELLAGEARAVVRAAGAAAEAARNAQAAAEAVLAGLESGPVASGLWQPLGQPAGKTLNTNLPAAAPSYSAPGYSAPAYATPTYVAPVAAPVAATVAAAPVHIPPSRWQDEPPVEAYEAEQPVAAAQLTPWAGAQPRWEEALPVTAPAPAAGRDVWSEMRLHPLTDLASELLSESRAETEYSYGNRYDEREGELFAHDDDAVGGATIEPVQHLPANLIEFPRELIATRKARPRLADGPYADAARDSSQLSIFEVDPELLAPPISIGGAMASVAPPEWASIELDHPEEAEYGPQEHAGQQPYAMAYAAATELPEIEVDVEEFSAFPQDAAPDYSYYGQTAEVTLPLIASGLEAQIEAQAQIQVPETPLQHAELPVAEAVKAELLIARMADRLLATVVDSALVTLAFLSAAVVVIASTAHPPTGRIALIASGCGLLIFWMLYQFLFLSYAEEGTPGMRYARIALCTFDDDNPGRAQMRKRIPAMLLSALPAGLGLAWALFDGDHLGWHDRLTKTYQRKY